MIVGIGVDIVDVSRVVNWLENNNWCQRVFHEKEMQTILSRGAQAAESMAARFAAKEAYIKALGFKPLNFSLNEIRVHNASSGAPELIPEGGAEEAMRRKGARAIHLSLAHERQMAVAQVILEA